MNPAQKRVWGTFVISLLTLIISGLVISIITKGYINLNNHKVYIITGIFMTIPLLSFALVEKVYTRKVCDERDMLIEKKATIVGTIGTLVVLALMAWLLTIQDFNGTITIQRKLLCSFIYLLIFLWNLCTSSVAIFYYYFSNTSTQQWQGESK